MTEKQIIRAIKKTKIIIANLKENRANKTLEDNYPYDEDIVSYESLLANLELKLQSL